MCTIEKKKTNNGTVAAIAQIFFAVFLLGVAATGQEISSQSSSLLLPLLIRLFNVMFLYLVSNEIIERCPRCFGIIILRL